MDEFTRNFMKVVVLGVSLIISVAVLWGLWAMAINLAVPEITDWGLIVASFCATAIIAGVILGAVEHRVATR